MGLISGHKFDEKCETGLKCPDDPEYHCGHTAVDNFVTIQLNAKILSTEGGLDIKLKNWKRSNGKFYFQFEYLSIGNYQCSGQKGHTDR